jgi:predicted nucleic acid-binding protein
MNDIYHSSDVSVVVDNNILIDLHELGELRLLFLVFAVVIIPSEIYKNEVSIDMKEELNSYPFQLGMIQTSKGMETYGKLVNNKAYKGLSSYDRWAIAIAGENDYYCNSNDQLIRKACVDFGIKVTGILGVLGMAYRMNLIKEQELLLFLDELVSDRTSCFIDKRIVEEFHKEMLDHSNNKI